MQQAYDSNAPARSDVDQLTGAILLEFGTNWCGHCSAAQPLLTTARADSVALRHLKVEDGPGRPLGRLLRVK